MIDKVFSARYAYYLVVAVLIVAAGVFYILTMDKAELTMVLEQETVTAGMDVSAASDKHDSKGSQKDSQTQGSSKAEGADEMIFVHLCGEVVHPKVYEVTKGSRLFEIIELAGGLTDDANEASVNMARVVFDGEKIYVASMDEVADKVAIAGMAGGKVSINNADLAALMTLPGVGESKAQAILDYRQENGGFQSVEDIMNVTGIKEAMYNKIKDHITL